MVIGAGGKSLMVIAEGGKSPSRGIKNLIVKYDKCLKNLVIMLENRKMYDEFEKKKSVFNSNFIFKRPKLQNTPRILLHFLSFSLSLYLSN